MDEPGSNDKHVVEFGYYEGAAVVVAVAVNLFSSGELQYEER